MALLPAVRKAYDALGAALVKAAALRGAVVEAIGAVGEVSPSDVSMMASIGWAELDLLDHRRQMVRAWTAQATENG